MAVNTKYVNNYARAKLKETLVVNRLIDTGVFD